MSEPLYPYDLGVPEPPGGFKNLVPRAPIPDLSEVTLCVPCDYGAAHPESHAPQARTILADRCPVDAPDELAVRILVQAVRNAAEVTGPLTIHQGPANDINTATGQIVREWIATQP
jgi:hypothetical protein